MTVLRGVLLVSLLCYSVSCFVFSVPSGTTECFLEKAEASKPVKMMFQVLDGGDMDVDFEVF